MKPNNEYAARVVKAWIGKPHENASIEKAAIVVDNIIAEAKAEALREARRMFDIVMSDLISAKLIKWESEKISGAMSGQEIIKRRAAITGEPPAGDALG